MLLKYFTKDEVNSVLTQDVLKWKDYMMSKDSHISRFTETQDYILKEKETLLECGSWKEKIQSVVNILKNDVFVTECTFIKKLERGISDDEEEQLRRRFERQQEGVRRAEYTLDILNVVNEFVE